MYQREALARLSSGRFAPVDTLRLLAIRVSFADLDFTSPPYDSVYFANELRHVREYFKGGSIGAFGLGWEIASGVTELSFEAAYYGQSGMWAKRVAEIMIEVVAKNDAAIDFSRFDAFALIHPGAGRETDQLGDSPWQMWSGFLDPIRMAAALADTLATPGVPTGDTLGGEIFYIDNVMVLPENASQDGMTWGSLGIYCYQIGLRLGMLPLWDSTPSGFPDSQGIGTFGLMGWGLYNAAGFIPAFPCAFNRYLMGWVEPTVVSASGTVRLPDVSGASGEAPAMARIDLSPSEYLLIENRLHDFNRNGRFDFGDVAGDGRPGNIDTLLGAEFDFFLTASTNPWREEVIDGDSVKITDTGCGIMIWHIDEAIIHSRLSAGGYVNDEARFKGVDLEEADGVQDLDRSSGSKHAFGSWGDSYRAGWYTRFGPDTDPSSETNTGRRTGLTIEVLSPPGPVMFFEVSFADGPTRVSIELEGDVKGLSPIVADIGDPRGALIVQAADTGRIYVGWGGDRNDWEGALTSVLDVPGAVWSGPPVVAGMGGVAAIFIASKDGRIHACRIDGEPVPLSHGDAPGSLEVAGTSISAPLALESGNNGEPEIIFLVSDGDTVWCYFLGRSEPLEGGFAAGNNVWAAVLKQGTLVSHPVAGAGPDGEGFYALTAADDRSVRLHFVRTEAAAELSVETWPVPRARAGSLLVTPCTGDIDGDGNDEFVAALPGCGLMYFSRRRGMHFALPTLRNPSPPALADIDGNGVLETLIRDHESLYLLTGLGTQVKGWPQAMVDGLHLLETAHPPAQPIAADVTGDGRLAALFNVAGNLWAFDAGGRPLTGWPIGGEADHTVTAAALRGDEERLFLLISGAPARILSPGQTGTSFSSQRSGISLIDTGAPWNPRGWLMYRHNAHGSGRQVRSDAAWPDGPAVDEASFICYPNPARGSHFKVRIDLSAAAEVTVRLFNLEGIEVHKTVERHEWSQQGVPYETSVPTSGLASGVYLCRLSVAGEGFGWSGARKVAVLK